MMLVCECSLILPFVRSALHRKQRRGAFVNCFSRKKSCSSALKTNSLPHSMQVKDRSVKYIYRRNLSSDVDTNNALRGETQDVS